jgi:hypothetical protein
MNPVRTSVAAIASTLVLGALAVTGVATANADDGSTEPCAKQQAQVDRATAKYDALQAKFAAHPTKKNQKAKKAQAQRVAHAQARLDKCNAGSEEPTETPAA